MKRLLVGIIMLGLIIGCTGLQIKTTGNVATDGAFYLVLKNNPDYKAPVIAELQEVKVFLTGTVTYDDLIIKISKAFEGKYAYIGVILSEYIDTDKPIFETHLTLFDAYKLAVLQKIDRLILLASL